MKVKNMKSLHQEKYSNTIQDYKISILAEPDGEVVLKIRELQENDREVVVLKRGYGKEGNVKQIVEEAKITILMWGYVLAEPIVESDIFD